MHTLEQLRSGELKGITRLSLREDLESFPPEIFDLADTLEILDLSGNRLHSLPPEIAKLKKLKIAFFSHNLFTKLPCVFKTLPHLYMLGFKANRIERFDADILPLSISWLILTDNRIKKLPDSMGKLQRLQKCALAGNRIETLPESMKQCVNLELLRLSANNLQSIPHWLVELPKLSWLAFSGNPCAPTPELREKALDYDALEINELLGEGASGQIFSAFSHTLEQKVALKLFKGAITSDGYAQDEMKAYMATGDHEHLIKVLGHIDNDEALGLLLEFIPAVYDNLGLPPNFDTCTRDTYPTATHFSLDQIHKIITAIRSAAAHLHEKNLMHGDLYAHNILINDEAHCYLGDFGAASFYPADQANFERIEVRAFGCLIEDLLNHCDKTDDPYYHKLQKLKEQCMNPTVIQRPLFSEMDLNF